MKLAWARQSSAKLESQIFKECSGTFGVVSHFQSNLFHYQVGIPATNHLLLESAKFWDLRGRGGEGYADRRVLVQHLSGFAGESLFTVDEPKNLFRTIIHAMLGELFIG